MTDQKLAGKKAIVTGAGAGIGQAIAKRFAAEGASVLCVDLNEETAAAVVSAIEARGGQALACRCDVSSREEAKAAVDLAVAQWGGVDILVCNAAVMTPKTLLHEMTEDTWDETINVNLGGSFLFSKYAIPHMLAAGSGNIIMVGSQMARVANPRQAAYCATKSAMVHLAKAIALEYAENNIRANSLSPGGTATSRMVAQFGDMENAERVWGATHPMNRLGQPDEMACGAVFLASDDSSFMTGADLLIDGGYAAR